MFRCDRVLIGEATCKGGIKKKDKYPVRICNGSFKTSGNMFREIYYVQLGSCAMTCFVFDKSDNYLVTAHTKQTLQHVTK